MTATRTALFSILALLAIIPTLHAVLPDLSAHRWKDRVLVVEAPSSEDATYREQVALWQAAEAGLRERDLVTKTTFGAETFRVRLVGKDGGVKADSREVISIENLFALIDGMPMRRAEMRQ